MGLDTSHDCWHGAYSAFHRWRKKICEVAGLGNLDTYPGYGIFGPSSPDTPHGFPVDHPLVPLLNHSDCGGEIVAADCGPLADALEALLPALELAGDGGGHIGFYAEKTKQFIKGLRAAAAAGEDVEFH